MGIPSFLSTIGRFASRIPREWRTPKVPLFLFAAEIPFTVAALALFGIADPDLYRTALWQEGANHDWNSSPIEILYAFANYKPIAVPTPWNQFITNFNVVIAVLSMFILIVKSIMYITQTFPPVVSVVVHGILTALYAVSISHQAASDMSDPLRPSKIPWYITRSCGAPVNQNLLGYCRQAKGAFAVTVCLCILFFTYTILSLLSALPTSRLPFSSPRPSDLESPSSSFHGDEKWEMEMNRLPHQQQKSGTKRMSMSKMPMTPRTLAFNTLDGNAGPRGSGAGGRLLNRDLPLRHHIGMGDETWKGVDGS